MSNTISLAEKYSPILDEIYKRECITAVLDTPSDLVEWVGAQTAKIFKTSLDGLGDYDRSTGFVNGAINGSWETLQLAYDRGRSLTCDAMDNEETLGMAFGTLAGEFVRTKELPEIDAYRFAKIASASYTEGGSTYTVDGASADITVGTTDCPSLIDTAEESMGDNEVPYEGRILFVSEKFYRGLKAKTTRYLANENGVQREIEMFNSMPVVRVPKNRFNTAIELFDGVTAGETAGGWTNVPSVGNSYAINFMIVHPSAISQVIKHRVPRIWTPEQNINADAYKFDIRVYGDTFVKRNKLKGVYVHRASTANS